MNTSSLANCPKRIQQFEELNFQSVEQTLFLKDYFYNWDKKDVKLKCNASREERKKYIIPRKFQKWPTKPMKGAAYPLPFNENQDFKDFEMEYDEKV
jgi:hypothetical protein